MITAQVSRYGFIMILCLLNCCKNGIQPSDDWPVNKGSSQANFSTEMVDEEAIPRKFNGVNFVGPSKPVSANCLGALDSIGADWVAFNPFIYGKKASPDLKHKTAWQWWGESIKGMSMCIDYARKHHKKVMIKPHAWIVGDGWPGEYDLSSEEEWSVWEERYSQFIYELVEVAIEKEVEVFCIGTEWRKAVQERPLFWQDLIDSVRSVYPGKLTYAANWDNYEKIGFWDKLDFIGIDAYFPLVEVTSPTKQQLNHSWGDLSKTLENFAQKHNKKVVFTEFGYRSIDNAAGKHWEIEDDWNYKGRANLKIQKMAYEALFEECWNKDWFGGGFLWKWYAKHQSSGGENNTDFTPQNKPASEVIRHWYGEQSGSN